MQPDTLTGPVLPPRARLTATHPHGFATVRRDGRFGLLRISKNASTELVERLDCPRWLPFGEIGCPVVLFLRDPVRRFLSSVPETVLRLQHPAIEDPGTPDRVIASLDVYREIEEVMPGTIGGLLERFLDLVEDAPFDAHHEPQASYFTSRNGAILLDGHAYVVERLEDGLSEVSRRFGVRIPKRADRRNVGGAKPATGSTALRRALRRMTGTGLYHRMPHAPLLAARYGGGAGMARHELNRLANRFAEELKASGLSDAQEARVRRIYEIDDGLWNAAAADPGRRVSELAAGLP